MQAGGQVSSDSEGNGGRYEPPRAPACRPAQPSLEQLPCWALTPLTALRAAARMGQCSWRISCWWKGGTLRGRRRGRGWGGVSVVQPAWRLSGQAAAASGAAACPPEKGKLQVAGEVQAGLHTLHVALGEQQGGAAEAAALEQASSGRHTVWVPSQSAGVRLWLAGCLPACPLLCSPAHQDCHRLLQLQRRRKGGAPQRRGHIRALPLARVLVAVCGVGPPVDERQLCGGWVRQVAVRGKTGGCLARQGSMPGLPSA